MKGDIAATVAAGDVITVTGKLLNYNGKIEFDAGCIGTAVAGEEAPAAVTGNLKGKYVGDYAADWIPASAFEGCDNGAVVTLAVEKLVEGRTNQWWNFTMIKSDWSKYLDAKYYIGTVPAFSEYEFVAIEGDTFTFTLSAEAVAQIKKDGQFGLQTDGVIFHTYNVVPVK